MKNEIIIKIDKGNKQEELRQRILSVINEYPNEFTGFELIGILDTVKRNCHWSIEENLDEEKDEN